ncbi:MAG: ABC transporter substrate-binding protein, partial [Chloroflexi bacterium]|nr:ABC transporter substrate-binding protein [Chloroflexota bacterium]
AEQGISEDDVNVISRATFGIDPLINGEVDVLAAWITNEGIMVREAGFEPNFILLSDYGVDTYDFVVFTTQDMVDNRPEVVNGFVDGLLAGIQDVISDPNKAIDYTLKYGPDLDRDQQFARLQATLPLMNVPNSTPGLMDSEIWEANQQLLLENDVTESEIDLSTVFTNRFVEGS